MRGGGLSEIVPCVFQKHLWKTDSYIRNKRNLRAFWKHGLRGAGDHKTDFYRITAGVSILMDARSDDEFDALSAQVGHLFCDRPGLLGTT
ncbi:hypothetical protein CDAR_614211 [Caerostris darwini]|uniref:Uncharacterized protein n=1 Tax=Caerostris darwini TaxID=1538125 RepID=A0AAV4WBM0_9ARAC|nr:hypothetical protein CDAR_614211 [Caerostris darwini]